MIIIDGDQNNITRRFCNMYRVSILILIIKEHDPEIAYLKGKKVIVVDEISQLLNNGIKNTIH